jgi:CheY-like chemotaxis protein
MAVGAYSILSIARYEGLQKTRTLILSRAGYEVCETLTDQQAIGFLEGSIVFDLVLMCHSVPEPSRLLLAAKIKASHPELPILMVAQGYETTAAQVDSFVQGLESPAALLVKVGALMTKREKPAGL